jgi:riboflavin kinase
MHQKNSPFTNFLLYELTKKFTFPQEKLFLTSKEFAHILGVSQQSSSRYLKNLEEEGLIRREMVGRGEWIELTEKGIDSLKKIHQSLKTFLSPKPQLKKILEGKVVSGLGEGAYYIRNYMEQLKERLGFKPYLGTLNIRLKHHPEGIERYIKIRIPNFSKEERTFGGISIIPVKFFRGTKGMKEDTKRKMGVNCYLTIPQRTHHEKNIIELIHRENLREKFKLKDGDEVSVELSLYSL